MNLSLKDVQFALEEFASDITEAVTTEAPAELEAADAQAAELTTQSELIDNDSVQLGNRIDQIGTVMERVENAPGEDDAPLDENVQAGATMALEALGIALEADEGETKETLLAKLRRWVAAAIEMARNFGRRVLAFAKTVYAFATDRSFRNKRRAERALARMNDKDFNLKSKKAGDRTTSATFQDHVSKSARRIVNNAAGVSVQTALDNLTKFLSEGARAGTKRDALDIAGSMRTIGKDPSTVDAEATKVLAALERMTDAGHKASSKGEHRKAVQAGEEVIVYTSAPFFGGFRSWVKMPKHVNGLQYWGHGLSKVDEIASRDRYELASVDELHAMARGCKDLCEVVDGYKKHLSDFNEVESMLSKRADATAGSAKDDVKSTSHVRQVVGALQSIVPRAIKGPNVAALQYAAEQGSALMSYIEASLNAYEEQSGAKKPTDLAGQVRNASTFGLKSA